MKKLIILAAALALGMGANAQEAFRHLSLGIEAGTTGAGVQMSIPVVTNHLVLSVGYNFPAFAVDFSTSVNMSEANGYINNANADLAKAGVAERISSFPGTANVNTKANVDFGAVKAMIEYYPSKFSSFHFTAGVYVSTGDFVSAEGFTDQSLWSTAKSIQQEVSDLKAKYGNVPEVQNIDGDFMNKLKANVNDMTVQLKEKDGCGYLDLQTTMPKARPYLGIGVGRTFPKGHFTVQGDLGVWYHGKLDFDSRYCKVAYDSSAEKVNMKDVMDILQKIPVYPQLSIRLIYKIF